MGRPTFHPSKQVWWVCHTLHLLHKCNGSDLPSTNPHKCDGSALPYIPLPTSMMSQSYSLPLPTIVMGQPYPIYPSPQVWWVSPTLYPSPQLWWFSPKTHICHYYQFQSSHKTDMPKFKVVSDVHMGKWAFYPCELRGVIGQIPLTFYNQWSKIIIYH